MKKIELIPDPEEKQKTDKKEDRGERFRWRSEDIEFPEDADKISNRN